MAEKVKKKILDAVLADNISKLRRIIRKYSVNMDELILNKKMQKCIHVACAYGSRDIVFYLLQKSVSVRGTDAGGNTPLHHALEAALARDRFVYVDVVKPVLDCWPEALFIHNNKNKTPSELLDQLLDSSQRSRSSTSGLGSTQNGKTSLQSDEEEEGAASMSRQRREEQEWREKLFHEMDAEQQFEKFEEDYRYQYSEQGSQETYDGWASRMSSEYYRKRKSQQPHSQERTQKQSKPEWTREDQTKFEKQLKEEQNQRQKRSEKLRFIKKLKIYDRKCKFLFDSERSSRITSSDIPFGDAENVAEVIKVLLIEEEQEHVKIVREHQIRWHPDRFMQKCGSRILDSDKEEVLKTVTKLSQTLNKWIQDNKDV